MTSKTNNLHALWLCFSSTRFASFLSGRKTLGFMALRTVLLECLSSLCREIFCLS